MDRLIKTSGTGYANFFLSKYISAYFNIFHLPCIDQIQKYINNQQYALQYSLIHFIQCSHQHVSAGIPAIFRVKFLLQEYNCG